MTKQNWTKILISAAIGILVAIISSLCDGLIDFLRGYGNDLLGGGATSMSYLISKTKIS